MQGVILGTAGYMSPEQARGKPVDRRADVWAFGCVLLEMLGGRQVFGGETISDTLAAVLKSEPDWESLPKDTPHSVRHLLKRCLDKDAKQRLRDVGEARILLDRVIHGDIEEPTPVGATIETRTSGRNRVAWLAASFAIAAVVGLSAWTLKPDPPEAPLRKFSLAVEREDNAGPGDPSISPDGKMVVYLVDGKLWVQELDQLKPRRLDIAGSAEMPFWSPDAAYIGYLSDGKLWKIPVAGGTSVKLCDPKTTFTGGRGAVWGTDGRIVYTYGGSGLYEVNAQGGDPRLLYDVDPDLHGDYHEPSFLPGGRGILYIGHRINGSPDTIELWANGERKELVQVPKQRLWSPQYSSSGHIIYRRSGGNSGVWAVPFSLSKLEVTGDPFLVAAEGSDPTISSDGSLVYLRGESETEVIWRWVTHDGVVGDSVSVPMREYAEPVLSPDGTRLAVTEFDGDEVDIWIHDLTRHTRTRFTFDDGEQIQPEWSPDGKQIYYCAEDKDSVFVRAADGTGESRAVAKGSQPDVSDDGRYLVVTVEQPASREDIWYVELGDDPQPKQFLSTPAREGMARLSPDGRYLAYSSDESGEIEVYIKQFPGGEGKWQVSIDGGYWPVWARDGKTLFFRHGFCDIVEVPVETQPDLVLGSPRTIIDCGKSQLTSFFYRCYDVSADGSQFLMLQSLQPDVNTIDVGITVVENWVAEFERHASR